MEIENRVQGLLQWRWFFNNNLLYTGYISIPILLKKVYCLFYVFHIWQFIFAINFISVLKFEFPAQTGSLLFLRRLYIIQILVRQLPGYIECKGILFSGLILPEKWTNLSQNMIVFDSCWWGLRLATISHETFLSFMGVWIFWYSHVKRLRDREKKLCQKHA